MGGEGPSHRQQPDHHGASVKESPVLIDGALAQFSYGAIEAHRLAGKQLPVPGGYDEEGREIGRAHV